MPDFFPHTCSIAKLAVDPKRRNREINADPLRNPAGISDGLLMKYFKKDRIEWGFCDRFLYAPEQQRRLLRLIRNLQSNEGQERQLSGLRFVPMVRRSLRETAAVDSSLGERALEFASNNEDLSCQLITRYPHPGIHTRLQQAISPLQAPETSGINLTRKNRGDVKINNGGLLSVTLARTDRSLLLRRRSAPGSDAHIANATYILSPADMRIPATFTKMGIGVPRAINYQLT
ncbi:hypothetical protein EV421DRAFT_1740280 [Armillaria borealis]|uniref:Uncharacterized protein n=1 Tax=Armillaria borealis TaxID=47425 RepID=A0AA39MIU3_9AGAR|nr:hypothetical protein EV421DRAFT_1740280 [Armillaria borealis]